MNQVEPGYYTVDEIADLLKVSTKTIMRLVRTGKMPAFKVGHQWRVTADQVNLYLDQNQNNKESTETRAV